MTRSHHPRENSPAWPVDTRPTGSYPDWTRSVASDCEAAHVTPLLGTYGSVSSTRTLRCGSFPSDAPGGAAVLTFHSHQRRLLAQGRCHGRLHVRSSRLPATAGRRPTSEAGEVDRGAQVPVQGHTAAITVVGALVEGQLWLSHDRTTSRSWITVTTGQRPPGRTRNRDMAPQLCQPMRLCSP